MSQTVKTLPDLTACCHTYTSVSKSGLHVFFSSRTVSKNSRTLECRVLIQETTETNSI